MVDVVELKKSEFWRKKFRRAVEVRDTDKNGSISRSDFEMLVEHYKKNAGATTDKIHTISKIISTFCDKVGLVDHNVVLGYEEFEHNWLAFTGKDAFVVRFKNMFKCLDANDLAEWKVHNAAFGIPPEHAEDSFKAIDRDCNGKITEDEFVNYHTEYFHTAENKLNSAILFGPL